VTHPEDVETEMQSFDALTAGERDQYQMEKRYLRRDGDVFWGT
jgi:hypothetical protein